MTYKTYIAVLVLSAGGAFLLTPLAKQLAIRLGAIDHPGGRKIHNEPTPRLGGLAVFGGFCIPWGFFYVFDNLVTMTFQNYEKLFAVLVAGALAMLGLGTIDDIKGLKAIPKFIAQIATAIGLYYGGYQINILSNPFGQPIALGWMSLPVSVLWMVGITNAINLLDGIDGLAAGVTACIAISLGIINILSGNIIVALLTLGLAGACLGFLPHNFAPAHIFLGDSGSLFMGMTLACIGILSLFKAATITFVAVPLILFALPLFDTTSVFLGRLWRGAPVFQGDRTHVHHRLLDLGMNHRQAALMLYTITAFMGFVSIALAFKQTPRTLVLGGLLLAMLFGTVLKRWRSGRQVLNPPRETDTCSNSKKLKEESAPD